MACSGCAQRRTVLAEGVRAIRDGDLAQAKDRLQVVGRSMTEDLTRLRTSALQAARDRLARR